MTDDQFCTLWTEARASDDRASYVSDWCLSSSCGDATDGQKDRPERDGLLLYTDATQKTRKRLPSNAFKLNNC